jgi:hypothetical protein
MTPLNVSPHTQGFILNDNDAPDPGYIPSMINTARDIRGGTDQVADGSGNRIRDNRVIRYHYHGIGLAEA